jgi:hypothetical protein
MKPLSGRFLCNLLPLNNTLRWSNPAAQPPKHGDYRVHWNADPLIELHPRVKLVYRSLALPEK